VVAAHDVQVGIPLDPLDRRGGVELPDPPSIDIGTDQHAPMPDGPVQLVTDVVVALEVGPHVEHHGSTGRRLHPLEERPELALDPRSIRPLRAVARQLEIDHGWQGVGIRGHGAHEVLGLLDAGTAQGEEVVRTAVQPGARGTVPVLPEPLVDEVPALGRLDVRECDPVARHHRPVDLTLVAGDVDAVALTRLQPGPVAGQPPEPTPPAHGNDRDENHGDHDRPAPTPPTPMRGLTRLTTGLPLHSALHARRLAWPGGHVDRG
jgi:hypothetical protein